MPWQSGRLATPRGGQQAISGAGRRSVRTELGSAAQVSVALGLVIVGWQSIAVSADFARFWNSPLWVVPHVAWPAMFFLLGFVLAREQTTESLPLGRLVVRGIAPLFLTITCTAFVLGPAVTTASLPGYFQDLDTWVYLLNLIGIPQFTLPGVFEFNDLTGIVNEPVWAVPCFTLTLLVAHSNVRIGSWRRAVAAAISVTAVGLGVADWFEWLDSPDRMIGWALAAMLAGQLGIIASSYGQRLRIGRLLPAVAVAALAAIAYLGRGASGNQFLTLQLIAALACVLALAASSMRLPFDRLSLALAPFLGAFLMVAFPIQQIAASWSSSTQGALGNLTVSLPIAALASIAVVWLSAAFAKMIAPTAVESLPILVVGDWRTSNAFTWLRRKRRILPPVLLLFCALVVTTLAVLAMTLFALQRNPWEN